MSASVAILNVQAAMTLAAQSYARTVVGQLAVKWGISAEALEEGLKEAGAEAVCGGTLRRGLGNRL